MYDRLFLMWLHGRLEYVHGEDPCVDYMHKLRAIISDTPRDKFTPNAGPYNSLEQLQKAED